MGPALTNASLARNERTSRPKVFLQIWWLVRWQQVDCSTSLLVEFMVKNLVRWYLRHAIENFWKKERKNVSPIKPLNVVGLETHQRGLAMAGQVSFKVLFRRKMKSLKHALKLKWSKQHVEKFQKAIRA